MKKILSISGLIVVLGAIGLISPFPVSAEYSVGADAVLRGYSYKPDFRTAKLEKFLAKFNSPYKDKAAVFVREADKRDLDYRLLVAISGVESTFGRNYIQGSHNAWGWGGGRIYFQSWDQAIERISQGLTQKPYRGKEVEKIAPTYCPPNSAKWTRGVHFFMEQIEKQEIADHASATLPFTL